MSYIENLEFDIAILKDLRDMNKISVEIRHRPFLDWSHEHEIQLQKMEGVLKYLLANPVYWDYRIVEEFYNKIPLQDDNKHTEVKKIQNRD